MSKEVLRYETIEDEDPNDLFIPSFSHFTETMKRAAHNIRYFLSQIDPVSGLSLIIFVVLWIIILFEHFYARLYLLEDIEEDLDTAFSFTTNPVTTPSPTTNADDKFTNPHDGFQDNDIIISDPGGDSGFVPGPGEDTYVDENGVVVRPGRTIAEIDGSLFHYNTNQNMFCNYFNWFCSDSSRYEYDYDNSNGYLYPKFGKIVYVGGSTGFDVKIEAGQSGKISMNINEALERDGGRGLTREEAKNFFCDRNISNNDAFRFAMTTKGMCQREVSSDECEEWKLVVARIAASHFATEQCGWFGGSGIYLSRKQGICLDIPDRLCG